MIQSRRRYWRVPPRQRLRCGSLGRRIRDDPAENGLSTVLAAVRGIIDIDSRQTNADISLYSSGHIPRTVFDNGVSLHTHFATAPEETLFLYDEIFEQRIYMRHGITLKEGNLVIDVGKCLVYAS